MARNCKQIEKANDEVIPVIRGHAGRNIVEKETESARMTFKELSEASEASGTKSIISTIEQGLDFMLEHFTSQETVWPRNISTAVIEGRQRPVSFKDTAVSYFLGSFNRDCKLACYPNYDKLIENGNLSPTYKPKPTHIFIDLDLSTFAGDHKRLDTALRTTLRNIKKHLHGAVPTVLWTGGGYHIHQPLDLDDMQHTFEDIPEFARFENPSVKFLRYAERKLTNGKSDPQHSISFKSCLTRVPGSVNIKHENDKDSKVKIIQRWNGIRAKPTPEFLVTDFYVWLMQEVIDEKLKELRMQKKKQFSSVQTTQLRTIAWIEKLIQTPIADYRKHAANLIIIPYLIVCRGMTDRSEIHDVVMNWADKCAELRRVDPSRREFSVRVRSRIDEVMRDRIPPMTLDTLKEKNPELYRPLKTNGGA